MIEQDDKLIKFLVGRQSKLETIRKPWEAEWRACADYVIPHREGIGQVWEDGRRQGTKIYDGTAVGAAVLATDGIHGYHVSPAFPWFKFQTGNAELDEMPDVKEWLQEEAERGVYNALNRTNFYDEMWGYIYDGLTIGTASIYAEEDIAEGKIIFETIHPDEVYVANNKYGQVDVHHRVRKRTAREIVQMFGETALPESIKNACRNNPFQEFTVWHCVFPREDFDDRKLDSGNKRNASVWYISDGRSIARISGYDIFPYAVWRYIRSGKETYGRSPALLALSDILGLNIMSKTLLGAAQIAVDPPLNVPSELQGKVQLKPRGLNYYSDKDKIVSPMNLGSQFPVGVDREQAKQKAIRDRFHVDTFLMLSAMEGRGQRTAYEVSELMGEKAAILGAELGPLNNQIDKILDRVFAIEYAAGRISAPPDALLEFGNGRIDTVYMGPLAQAQRAKFGMQGIKQGIEAIAPMIPLFPEIKHVINPVKTAKAWLSALGFPQKCINSDDDISAAIQAEMEAIAAEKQGIDLMNAAKGAKDVASADKDMGGGIQEMLMNAGGVQ